METIKLYTYHNPEFDITKQKSLLQKSEDADFLTDSYQWLHKTLGKNSFIWCWGSRDKHSFVHGREEKEWVLEVPREEIIATLNSSVWDCMILDAPYIPEDLMWWYALPDEKFEEKLKEWVRYNPMRGWDKLFQIYSENDLEYAQYLIPSPIKKEWVVEVNQCSGWGWDTFSYPINEHCFSKKESAEKMLKCAKSFLGDLLESYSIEERRGWWYLKIKYDGDLLNKKKGLKVDG